MIQFKISAPGKVILFGEHAVVYGKTAIAASVDLRTTLNFVELPDTKSMIKVHFSKINLSVNVPFNQIQTFLLNDKVLQSVDDHDSFYGHIQKLVEMIGYDSGQQKLSLSALFYLLVYVSQKEQINVKPFQIEINTDLSISSGLGSSASFAVCLAACFLHWSHLQKNVKTSFDACDLETISKYAFQCERLMHGMPSGIDNSVCTYGSVIEFRKNVSIKPISGVPSMRILLVDTRVQRSTKVLLERLIGLKRKYPAIVNLIMDAIDNISKEALNTLIRMRDLSKSDEKSLLEQYRQLMTLITMNQGLLSTCQVSHPSLNTICAEAENYGLAAKLTGAGGGGYAYILLLPDTQPEIISSISRKLIADGFSVILTTLGCSGVKIC